MKRSLISLAKRSAALALLATGFAGQVAVSSAAQYQIIPTNQTWKYIVPTDNTFCLNGTGWEAAGFDDTSWAGPAPAGFTGGENVGGVAGLTPWINTTSLPAPTASQGRPYYFRTHFTLTNIAQLRLFFTNRIDDQAVWYINGTRVFDLNHPDNPETCAPGGTGGGEANTNFVFMLTEAQTAGLVVLGDNVLAVSVHQNGTGSSDMVFGMTMWGQNVLPDTPIVITGNPTNVTVNERSPASFTVTATGDPLNYHWLRDGVAIPGAPNLPTYTLPSAAYPADNNAMFSVIVSNSTGPVTSGAAKLTVIPDTAPPTVLSVVGDIDPTLVHITFSEPMDPAFINEGNFSIYLTGGAPGDYFTYAVAFTNGTNVTITTDPRLAGQNYSIQMLDLRDASSGNNLITPNPLVLPIRPTVQLIAFDAVWKYFIGSDIFGTGWEQPGYDDSAWPSGPAGLGLDVSANGVPIVTTIPYTAQSEPSWYRTHFSFPGSVNGATLTIRDVVEDGAVYYLNGQEVFRHNVGAGALTYASRAAGGQVDPTPIQGPFNIAATNLLPGDNVLAVVVLQSGATSSDVELAVQLNGTISAFVGGPPHITAVPQNQTVNEGGTATFTVVAEGTAPLTYEWRKGGVAIPGAPNSSTYTITGAVPANAGNYNVFISNAEGNTNSPIATLTVIPDTSAPYIISARGDTNLSIVTVTLHDDGTGIDLTKAQTAGNYQIALTAGGGALTVSSAVATNIGTNTIVTLTTTTPRTAGQNYTLTINGVTDRSVAANPVTPNTARITATLVLNTFTSVWRYDQSGTDLGTAWKDVGFNDAAWPQGAGVLGFETSSNTLVFLRSIAPPDGTNTILSLTNQTGGGLGGTNVAFYFRSTVNVPFNPAGATFTLRAYVDDGAILYINGVERWRYNMTNPGTFTSFANAALTEPNPNPQTTYVVTNLTGLVQGNNLIAVEVHQDGLGSSDIDWGMQLEANVSDFNAVAGPTLNVSRNGNQITVTWSGGGTLQEATDLLNGGATAWTDVPGNPQGTYTTTTTGPRKFYRVRVP